MHNSMKPRVNNSYIPKKDPARKRNGVEEVRDALAKEAMLH